MKNSLLSRRLKNLREEKGYLQKFVADKVGVKSNTLSGYENGTRTPDLEMIINLAKLYNVTTDYLLGHSNEPKLTEDEEFEEFVRDLRRWYEESPKDKEEDLQRLRRIFEVIQND